MKIPSFGETITCLLAIFILGTIIIYLPKKGVANMEMREKSKLTVESKSIVKKSGFHKSDSGVVTDATERGGISFAEVWIDGETNGRVRVISAHHLRIGDRVKVYQTSFGRSADGTNFIGSVISTTTAVLIER